MGAGERRNFTIEAEEEQNSIVLRPYVRPFHCSLYATKQHSYKELPIKYSETSTVFRDEPTSKIRGLTCMRQYSFQMLAYLHHQNC